MKPAPPVTRQVQRSLTDTTVRGVGRGNVRRPMSTRRLIIAALLCGLAILVAFTVQVFTAR